MLIRMSDQADKNSTHRIQYVIMYVIYFYINLWYLSAFIARKNNNDA